VADMTERLAQVTEALEWRRAGFPWGYEMETAIVEAAMSAVRASRAGTGSGDPDDAARIDQLEEDRENIQVAAEDTIHSLVAGAPKCSCGKPATCVGAYERPENLSCSCDDCCGHGNEDGWCVPVRAPGSSADRALLIATTRALDLLANVKAGSADERRIWEREVQPALDAAREHLMAPPGSSAERAAGDGYIDPNDVPYEPGETVMNLYDGARAKGFREGVEAAARLVEGIEPPWLGTTPPVVVKAIRSLAPPIAERAGGRRAIRCIDYTRLKAGVCEVGGNEVADPGIPFPAHLCDGFAAISSPGATGTDPVREAARDLYLASDEDDGEFSGDRLDLLRLTREKLGRALSGDETGAPSRETGDGR